MVIKFDNEVLVSVVNSGVTTMARNIWLPTTTYNINVKLVHIPGLDNACADLLCRCKKQGTGLFSILRSQAHDTQNFYS